MAEAKPYDPFTYRGIPKPFHKIEAYTNGYQIVVIGIPPELPEDDPLSHSCDAMGCGSLDHVVARIPVMEPTPELDWSGSADFDPENVKEEE